MIGVGLTRTRLSTRLGLSIGERLATLANTLADSTLPISAIPGLLDRVNALDARLTALGLAAVDPDVADAIAAVLVDLAEAIDAIDLHRTLAVVLPALEAAMTQLEEAAQNPGSIDWGQPGIDWGQPGVDWGGGGGGTPSAQTFAIGPPIAQAGETTPIAQTFTLGPPLAQAGEATPAIQTFILGPPIGTPAEEAGQTFVLSPTPVTAPKEGS